MSTSEKGILRSGIFYINHLDVNKKADRDAVDSFYIENDKGQGLSWYLKEKAFSDEASGEMRTYLVRLIKTDECVGYFSLKAGLISLNEIEVEVLDRNTGEKHIEREFDTLPGIELANFAVNSNFIHKYSSLKGVGHVIFTEFIIPIINEAAKHVAIKIVYIFALPFKKLIARYERYGFKRLPSEDENTLHTRLKPRYDESCKFMYLLLQ